MNKLIPIEASSPSKLPICLERVHRFRKCLLRNIRVDWASSTKTPIFGFASAPLVLRLYPLPVKGDELVEEVVVLRKIVRMLEYFFKLL